VASCIQFWLLSAIPVVVDTMCSFPICSSCAECLKEQKCTLIAITAGLGDNLRVAPNFARQDHETNPWIKMPSTILSADRASIARNGQKVKQRKEGEVQGYSQRDSSHHRHDRWRRMRY